MSNTQKHWLALVIAIGGPALMTALVELQKLEPAWAWLGLITPILGTLLAKYTPSPQDEAKMARLTTALGQVKADQGSRGTERGFVTGKTLLGLLGAFVAGIAIYFGAADLMGCGTAVSPTVPPTIVDTGSCILDVVGKDLLAGDSIEVAIADAATRCLGSASEDNKAQVRALWAAHLAAEVRERTDGGGEQ